MTPLAGWENCYVIVGSSAGALIGLQFVVMALIAERPSVRDAEGASSAFATPTIVHFGAVLLLASIGSMPWHEIGAAAAVAWGVLGVVGADICRHCGPAHANPTGLFAAVRGLVISRPAAVRGLRDANRIGLRCADKCWLVAVCCSSDGAVAPLRRHSQCLGCSDVPRSDQP
jgi:hypothetical protein